MELSKLLAPYNPWIEQGEKGLEGVPEFTRPVFSSLLRDLGSLPQILSIIGPRRIGKSTLLRQIIRHYLREERRSDQLIYYSFDDPALFLPKIDVSQLMEALMTEMRHRAGRGKAVLFLDEVQRLEGWELYLKKYYDLKYPIRFVVSGSASSPIFKKTRESLLGRVKEYHLLPFSFREFAQYQFREEPTVLEILDRIHDAGVAVMGMLAGDPRHVDLEKVTIKVVPDEYWGRLQELLNKYFLEGGFPEVWIMPTWDQKVEYLYDNQVKKVIYEDLVLAAELRKPEQLKQFYIALLEQPGREVNLSLIAKETGIILAQVEKYLPLLEMTDLVSHAQRFRRKPLRVRRGNVKFYLVDLALRNAVLRLDATILKDAATLGLYAENLVFNALRKWTGIVRIDYFKDREGEVDFVVHLGGRQKYVPFEVKFRDEISGDDLRPIRAFGRRFGSRQPIVVTKQRHDFGNRGDVFFLPLLQFLLMFD